MRVKEIEFAGKKLTIREKKIKELKALAEKIGVEFQDIFKADEVGDVLGVLTSLLNDKIPEIFPEITSDDVDEAYSSEVEELISAFMDVNFSGLKKVVTPMLKLIPKQ